jgi:hypothetical protein
LEPEPLSLWGLALPVVRRRQTFYNFATLNNNNNNNSVNFTHAMNCKTNTLIKYSNIIKKKETKGTEVTSKLIRCKERIVSIRPKDGGFFVSITKFIPVAKQPLVGQGLLTIETSR